jgi:hypothetical protein
MHVAVLGSVESCRMNGVSGSTIFHLDRFWTCYWTTMLELVFSNITT